VNARLLDENEKTTHFYTRKNKQVCTQTYILSYRIYKRKNTWSNEQIRRAHMLIFERIEN